METSSFNLSDDDVLNFTQSQRKNFIATLIEDKYPTDTKEQRVFLTALADMDRVALGKKRILNEEKISQGDALVHHAISAIIDQFGVKIPFQGQREGPIPSLDANHLPEANPVPGETDVGVSDQNYEELTKRFDRA